MRNLSLGVCSCACMRLVCVLVCSEQCVGVWRRKGRAPGIVPGSKCVCLMSSWWRQGGGQKGSFPVKPL